MQSACTKSEMPVMDEFEHFGNLNGNRPIHELGEIIVRLNNTLDSSAQIDGAMVVVEVGMEST